MAGASDYMVGNAPAGASYTAPQVGAQLGQMLAQYPQQYFQGQQRQRELAVMNAFPNGVPIDPATGGPDLNAVMSTLTKAGGGQYVQQLMPFLIQQQVGQQAGKALGGVDSSGGPPGANTGPRASTVATSPASLQPQQPQQPQQPPVSSPAGSAPTGPMSSTGMDNNGADTVRSIMSERAGGRDVSSQIASVARTLRLNPDAPLTPQQVQQVRSFRQNAVGLNDESGSQPPPQAPQTAPQQPPSNPALDAQVAQMTQQMNTLNDQAGRIETYAATTAAVNPATSTAALAKAKALREQANSIEQNLFKLQQQQQASTLHEQESTPEMKNATRGADAINQQKLEQEQQKALAVTRNERAKGYNTQGDTASKALPMTEYALKLANSPDFIAGSGKPFRDALANIGQTLGYGQSASIGQIFDKLRSETVLNGIRSMAGTGPVRVAEMHVIEQASGDRANQAEAVRAVLIMQQRAYQKQLAIKNVIAQNKGIIDDNAEAQINQIMAKPLFSDAEMKDPHALGAPTFNTPQEMAAAHLPPNAPFRTPDGRVKYNRPQQ